MQQEKLSLIENFRTFHFLLNEFKKRIKVFFLLLLFVSLLGAIKYLFFNKVQYEASILFMINDEESSGASGLLNIASQFGFSSSISPYVSNEKVVDLTQTNYIINRALLFMDNEHDRLLGNIMIDSLGLQANIKKRFGLTEDFHFKNEMTNNCSALEVHVLNWMTDLVRESYLTVKPNPSGIISCKAVTSNQYCSAKLVKLIVNFAGNYYVSKKTERLRFACDIIQHRADSLHQKLLQSEGNLASRIDENTLLVKKQGLLSQNSTRRDVQFLTSLYEDAVHSYNNIRFSMEQSTPVFQIIDNPILPLEPKKLKLSMVVYYVISISTAFYLIYIVIINSIESKKDILATDV